MARSMPAPSRMTGRLADCEAGDDVGDDFGGDGLESLGEGGNGGVESRGFDLRALDVQRDFEEDGGLAAIFAGADHVGEGGLIDDLRPSGEIFR